MTDDELDPSRTLYPSRDQVEALVKALDILINRTGPDNDPPGFAESIAEEEEWVGAEVFSNWCALEAVLEAIPASDIPVPFADENFEAFLWWASVGGPIERTRDIAEAVSARWQIPVFIDEPAPRSLAKSTHLRRYFRLKGMDGKSEGGDFPHAVVSAEEHSILVWTRKRLVAALEMEVGVPTPESVKEFLRDEKDPSLELGEADIVDELRNRKRPRPSQARLVEFMMGRKSATYEEASDPIYGVPDADHDRFRKTAERVNRFLELRKSRIKYELGDERIYKNVADD